MDVCIWCIFLIFFKFQQIHFSRTSQFHFTKSSSNRHHKLLPTYSQYGKNRSHLIFFASTKVYVDKDQGIHKVKIKVARNEKRKKLLRFSFSINIANFEVFRWTKKLISNLFFLKSVIQ